uniref:Uncharacterized protein n=1 Tax=Trichogramma kaykai TaxID=54128 RepID=A0ABD2XEG4_9HYME
MSRILGVGCIFHHDEHSSLKKKWKGLRENINWEIERERFGLLDQIYTLISEWELSRYPDLRKYFRPEEIERLLSDSINYTNSDRSYCQSKRFINFVIKSGYKDKPEVDKDGKPLLRRTTALHHAARYKYNEEIVGMLFKIYKKFEVNYTNELGLSHFHIACEFGCDEVVKKFLKLGQDPNCLVAKTGDSPLHLALEREQKNVVELLLRNGANPNLANKIKLTPLQIICKGDCDDYNLVKMLFELSKEKFRPVQVNVQDMVGITPLLWALSRDRRKLVKLFLRNGANPNLTKMDGSTSLHVIGQNSGDGELVKMLFALSKEKYHPMQIDAQDKWGRTPLHLALIWKNRKMFEFLLRRGASPNLANKDGSTPLHIICKRAHYHNEDDDVLVELFFKIIDEKHELVQVDAQDELGNTPLHLALRCDNKKAAEMLLRRGANPNLANKDRLTPLHIICKRYQDDGLAEMLFRISKKKHHLVQIDVQDKLGQTPLQLAVANLLPNVVDALLNHGADLSNFSFPTEAFFTMRCNPWIMKLGLASLALIVIERLRNKGYEMKHADALTIMNLFANHRLFENSVNLQKCWYDDDDFVKGAEKIMVRPSLSLYDLIRLQPKEAAKLLAYEDYFEFWSSRKLCQLPKIYHEACLMHLCEKLSRGFFRHCALYPFWELTRYRLPIEICEIIIDTSLTNMDLWNICLAFTD